MDRKNDGLRLMDGAGYKKIIIACDSYKGCLSSREVNEAIASGVKEWDSEDASSGIENVDSEDASPEIICLEMSDGGEGMLDAFLSAMKGERVSIHAHDALMRWIEAEYGIVNDTAIIEIAQTAGLALIEPEQRNPLKATSWGVGEMIMNAYRRGVPLYRRIGRKCYVRLRYRNAQGNGRRLEENPTGMQFCAGFGRYQSALWRKRGGSCFCASEGS